MSVPPHASFDFTAMMMAGAGCFTVGFVAIAKDSAHSRGSGTLIRFGNVAGVLTCAHVLEDVLKQREIGLVCFSARPNEVQMLKVELKLTQQVFIKSKNWNEFGPDLAFLRIPDLVMGQIEHLASVVDGHRHRANALAKEPDPKHRVELVCGVVDERTGPAITKGNVAITSFEALINVGRVIEKSSAEGMDLYRFRPVPGEGVILPKSYRGTSGGGLWRMYIKPEAGDTFSLVQARLAGVAFWEKPVDHELHIICHGQKSIYFALFEQIRKKWPQ